MKSYPPKFGSFRDYITITASDTTLVKASDIEANIKHSATTSGSSTSNANKHIKAVN